MNATAVPRRKDTRRLSSLEMPPVYVQLADSLEEMIRRRSFHPGDRVPSVRQFSREQRVSIPTALHAYATLEARGWIEARPKSGFYVCSRLSDTIPQLLQPTTSPRISDLAETDPLDLLPCDEYEPEKVHFGTAVPSPDLLPGLRLARIMAGVTRRLGVKGANYGPLAGAPELRREIARRSLSAGLRITPDDLVITLGATEAIALALRAVCMPGDTVIVESPTFFGLLRQLREMGLKALPIPVHATEGIDLDALARALGKNRVGALLLVPNFHNPVGFVMPDARKQELVRLAASRNLPVIEDDIYGDMPHHGVRPRALKAFDPNGIVIHCGSYSKSIAPGYRIGYIAAGKWQDRVLALKKVQSGGNPLLSTLAVAEFLRDGGYDRFLRSFRESCRLQVTKMRDAIAHSFPEEIRLSRPAGGFILWCELSARVESMELFHRARAAGIAIAPGPFFSSDGGFRNFIRISCGYPWSSKIERGVHVLGQLVREMTADSAAVAKRPGSAQAARPDGFALRRKGRVTARSPAK
jgi:DNA-binding transcriptional MocR family regulator